MEAYCHWCSQKGVESSTGAGADYYELEINFYTALLRTLFSTVIFHAAVLASCVFLPKSGIDEWNAAMGGLGPRTNSMKRGSGSIRRKSIPSGLFAQGNLQFSYWTLWKGLCLSGFTQLFKLIALIWSYANDYPRIMLVECLFVLSNTQCYFGKGFNRPLAFLRYPYEIVDVFLQ